jgi:mRNA-degrading endonuclease HigB of HigAB toxin-antitoxin module
MYVYHYYSTPLSTNENLISNKTIITPNPFSDKLTITLNEINLPSNATIFDVTGKELLLIYLENTNSELELSSLKSGIYFCQLHSNGRIETIKIIKK